METKTVAEIVKTAAFKMHSQTSVAGIMQSFIIEAETEKIGSDLGTLSHDQALPVAPRDINMSEMTEAYSTGAIFILLAKERFVHDDSIG